MGGKAEECKHVIGMKVSFRSALAIIVFLFLKYLLSEIQEHRRQTLQEVLSKSIVIKKQLPCYSFTQLYLVIVRLSH